MSDKPAPEKRRMTAGELREFFSAFSTELPALIKSIIASVFSEESGRNMGKAAAAFYKELKDSGMPDDVAVKMTEDYIGVFTSLGDLLKQKGGKFSMSPEKGKELGEEIERRIKAKIAEKRHAEAEEEEEEEEE